MNNLILRTARPDGETNNLSPAEVDSNMTVIKQAVEVLEGKITSLLAIINNGGPADADAIINKFNEVIDFISGIPEQTGGLLTRFNQLGQQIAQIQQQLAAIQQGGGSGTGSGSIGALNVVLPVDESLNAATDPNGYLINLGVDPIEQENAIRDILAQIGGRPTWAKPLLSPFDDSDILAISSSGAMEYTLAGDLSTLTSIGELVNGSYSATYQMGNFNRPLGFLWIRTKATSEKSQSAWVKSPVFTAASGNAAPNLLPASENMNQRPPWAGNQSGVYSDSSPIIAPDGSSTMTLVTAFGTDGSFDTPAVTLELNKTYIFSGIYKKVTKTLPGLVQFTIETGLSKATFNMNTGQVTGIQNCTCRFTDQSPQGANSAGCWLVEMIFSAGNTSQQIFTRYDATNGGAQQGSNFGAWRWAVNPGNTRATYQPTYA